MSASDRVRASVDPAVRETLEGALSTADLTTLLLDVAAARAVRRSTTDIARAFAESRFTTPSATDARRLTALDHEIWTALPPVFDAIELSPVTPLGTCSILGPVDQNNVVSTMRGTEVVSDATDVLALEAARRRRTGTTGPIHLAASHRVLRAQRFDDPAASSHFQLFNLLSSMRDRGSGQTEAELLTLHLRHWLDAVGPSARIGWTVFRDGAVAERLRDTVLPRFGDVTVELPRRSGAGYYLDVAFKIFGGEVELGDGGFTSWTATLTHDAKERCLISCLSQERLLAVRGGPGH